MSVADKRGMLDTSTVILPGRLDDPEDLPQDSMISAVTLAELSVGPHVARTARERAGRQSHLQQAVSDFDAVRLRGGESLRAARSVVGFSRT